jgi:hypothetical protein
MELINERMKCTCTYKYTNTKNIAASSLPFEIREAVIPNIVGIGSDGLEFSWG